MKAIEFVGDWLQRIQAYDKATGLLAVRVLNPDLEKEAAAKDQLLQQVCASRLIFMCLLLTRELAGPITVACSFILPHMRAGRP